MPLQPASSLQRATSATSRTYTPGSGPLDGGQVENTSRGTSSMSVGIMGSSCPPLGELRTDLRCAPCPALLQQIDVQPLGVAGHDLEREALGDPAPAGLPDLARQGA